MKPFDQISTTNTVDKRFDLAVGEKEICGSNDVWGERLCLFRALSDSQNRLSTRWYKEVEDDEKENDARLPLQFPA
ncbi:unnamed protein product [Musa hybrid cultivar]